MSVKWYRYATVDCKRDDWMPNTHWQEYVEAQDYRNLLERYNAVLIERDQLRAELDHFKNSGIVEVAIRNASVSEYMRHWEGRTEKAEAELARVRGALTAVVDAAMLYGRSTCVYHIHFSHLDKARAALAAGKGEGEKP